MSIRNIDTQPPSRLEVALWAGLALALMALALLTASNAEDAIDIAAATGLLVGAWQPARLAGDAFGRRMTTALDREVEQLHRDRP